MEKGLLVDPGPVGRAEGDGVGVLNCTKLGQTAVGKSMGDRVGTTDGVPPGDVFNSRAVGDGDGSLNGGPLGKSVIGSIGGLSVGVNTGVAEGLGTYIKDGDPLGGGIDGEIDCDGIGGMDGNKPGTSGVGIVD